MKVLFVSNEIEKGGATKSMLTLVKQLKHLNIKCIVITPVKNGYVYNYCKNNNIECYYIKYHFVGLGFNFKGMKKFTKMLKLPYHYICNKIFNFYSLKRISSIIDINTIDIIHTNVNRDNFGIQIAKKYKKKCVMHLREFGTLDYNCIYLRKNIYSYFNDNVDYFIAISSSIKNFFIEKGIDNKKINLIYNGVNENDIRVKDYTSNVSTSFLNIVMVGNIQETKGQIQVIEALNLCDKVLRRNIKLYLYGSGDNNYILELKKLIKCYNLEKNIIFMGYNDNIYSEIVKYDCAIMASASEAFGRVTVEYMLSKIPVIASNTGANSEIILDNESGLLYEYNNIEQLKEKILILYYNKKNVRNYIANNAYLRAKDNFTAEINARNIKLLYEKII